MIDDRDREKRGKCGAVIAWHNNRMEPTWRSGTALTYARSAPLCHAAHPEGVSWLLHLLASHKIGMGMFVLLPGMDDTGKLFQPFRKVLGDRFPPCVVSYPVDRF
jgi:hypothetical protein